MYYSCSKLCIIFQDNIMTDLSWITSWLNSIYEFNMINTNDVIHKGSYTLYDDFDINNYKQNVKNKSNDTTEDIIIDKNLLNYCNMSYTYIYHNITKIKQILIE